MKESYIRFIQYVLGAAIVILILLHLSLFTSFIGPGYEEGLSWETVSQRMASPFYDMLYTLLLFALLTHGFIGIRNIIFEYVTNQRTRVIISWTIWTLYLILLIYGMLPIIS